MSRPTLTVIAFPGNNCETETARAAARNGFDANIIRWNQPEEVGKSDAYIVPGGFSFEDRGRAGAIASREPIFDALREEAKKGKVILGICNGAQMIVESGLIPMEGNSLPLALADNVRRDADGHVVGTGYYNTWVYLQPARKDTAFTCACDGVLHVPIAHGEGRFTTVDAAVSKALTDTDNYAAYRYCNEDGEVSEKYPTTPNGALGALAAVTNKEGTIMAMMPHPERFFTNFGGDQILSSMRSWVEDKKSPSTVEIGTDDGQAGAVESYTPKSGTLVLEKKVIITDNERFSVEQAAKSLGGQDVTLSKSVLYEIEGDVKDLEAILETGILLNPNKEYVVEEAGSAQKFAVLNHENDMAEHLSESLSNALGKKCHLKMMTCWDFGESPESGVEKVLQNRLLSNPNSSKIYKLK